MGRAVLPAGRWLLALVISAVLVVSAQILVSPGAVVARSSLPDLRDHHWDSCATGGPRAGGVGNQKVLILHDLGGRGSDAGVVYATLMANLASHFGTPKVHPASTYRAGELLGYDATIYVGSRFGEVLPAALLPDVRSARRPVLWLKENIHQLAPPAQFRRDYGWLWKAFDGPSDFKVHYKGAVLHPSDAGDGLTTFAAVDGSQVDVLATASAPKLGSVPWAVRSRNLTYIGDLPLSGGSTSDASLALADVLAGLMPRPHPDRHRALVRIEDVGPMSNPAELRAIARSLKSRHVPYSIAVYPVYVGPVVEQPRQVVHLRDRPEVVRAIADMLDGGATLVLHGYSHQFADRDNPRTGESGTDFEFFLAHLDQAGDVIYDGAVPGDSAQWATRRIDDALAELSSVGLPRPTLFNVPHYAASAADYRAIGTRFAARYDRGQYYAPGWNGSSPAGPYMSEQSVPYLIRDAYGSLVVPENLGYVSDPDARSGPNTGADILAGASSLLQVRDSVASFFYHPFLGPKTLDDLVDRMQAMGYTFVSPCDL